MKKNWEKLLDEGGFDTQIFEQVSSFLAVEQHKKREANKKNERKLERLLQKRKVLRACVQGLLRVQTAQSEILATLQKSDEPFISEHLSNAQHKMEEVLEHRETLQAMEAQIKDLEIFELWLKITQNDWLSGHLEKLKKTVEESGSENVV
jgi:hypothetical protein